MRLHSLPSTGQVALGAVHRTPGAQDTDPVVERLDDVALAVLHMAHSVADRVSLLGGHNPDQVAVRSLDREEGRSLGLVVVLVEGRSLAVVDSRLAAAADKVGLEDLDCSKTLQ